MAAKQSSVSLPASQTPGDFATLAARLVEHAATIRNPAAAKAMGDGMREGARVIRHLRQGIQDIIKNTTDDGLRARLAQLLEG